MELEYAANGDYLVPALVLDEEAPAYGKYGMLRKRHLQEHRRGLYAALLLKGNLVSHLNETDALAHEFISRTVKEMAKRQGITEAMKAGDQVAWVGAMNALKAQAEEAALAEFVYAD